MRYPTSRGLSRRASQTFLLLAVLHGALAQATTTVVDVDGEVIAHYDPDTGTFSETVLWDADLENLELAGLNGESVQLVSAVLDDAQLTNAAAPYADFFMASMQRVSLVAGEAQFADFSLANLNNANLNTANLSNTLFYRSNLASASFKSANLRDADFRGADLSATNFYLADLTGAQFGPAARGNRQRYTPIASADFRAADLTGSIGLETTDGGAIYDANTTLGDTDPIALGWENRPRRTLNFSGQYIVSVAYDSALETSNASLAEAAISTPNTETWPNPENAELLEELASYRIGGVANAETLSVSVKLDPSISNEDVRLWQYRGTQWQELEVTVGSDNSLSFSASDGDASDNDAQSGRIRHAIAASISGSGSRSAPLPVPAISHLQTALLISLLLGFVAPRLRSRAAR